MPRHDAPSGLAHAPARAEDLPDLELVRAIRSGDEDAFAVLYERYFDRVHHFAHARLRNRADAEEVAQETFIAVFRSMDAFQGRSNLLSWIYGIAKNTVNNHLRRAAAYGRRIERAADELLRTARSHEAASPEEEMRFQRCAKAVERSLGSVSGWQAEVFAMRHLEHLPIQEIADRMSRSNDAIRSSLYRVKRLIVESVGAEDARWG